MAEGIACSRIQFPKGMDANEYALKVQPARRRSGVLLRSAVWLGSGKRRRASRRQRRPAATAEAAALPRPRPSPEQLAPPAVRRPTHVRAAGPFSRYRREASSHAGAAVDLDGSHSSTPDGRPADLDEVVAPLGDRRYRVRGLRKNLAYGVLKLNVLVTREGPEAEALFAPPSPSPASSSTPSTSTRRGSAPPSRSRPRTSWA